MNKDTYIKFRVTTEDKKEIVSLAKSLEYDSVSDYLYCISLSGLTKNDRVLLFNEIHKLRMKNVPV